MLFSRAPFPSPFPIYSYRNASTGSSRAALPAGYSPKSTPVRIEEITAATTAPAGTVAGLGVKERTPR